MKKTPLKLLQSSIKVLLTREVFTRQMIFWNKSTYLIRNSNSWKLYAKYYIYAIKRWFHENTWLIVFSSISSPIFLTTIPYAIIIIIATINAAGKRRLRVQKNRPIFFILRVSRAAGSLNATIDESTFFIITSTVLFPSIVGTFFAFHPDLYDHQSDKSVAIVVRCIGSYHSEQRLRNYRRRLFPPFHRSIRWTRTTTTTIAWPARKREMSWNSSQKEEMDKHWRIE